MRPIGRLRAQQAIVILSSLLFAATAHAQAVSKVDPRALAMGGGYVAVADGWAAMQWNPAGMWVSGRNEAAVTFGNVPLEAGPWVESLRVAAGFSVALDPAEAAATIGSTDAGLAGDRTLGVYVMSKRFGGAFQQITYVNEMSRVQVDGIDVDQAALRTREYLLSVAQPLLQGRVAIGASFKVVQAQGRYQLVPLQGLGATDLAAAELLAAARGGPVAGEQTVFTVDAGVLVMATAKFRVGGVVKNLNAPSIETGTDVSMHLPRQVRVGGLLLPHPDVKLSFDVDLYADSFVRGLRERRELGGGIEWDGGPVAVRGGLFLDLDAIERRSTYTFGLGFNGRVVRLDVAASWGAERDGFGWIGALAADF